MYLSVNPPVAFPLALDPWGRPQGLGSAIPVAGLISSGLSIVDTAIKLILNSGCGVTCVETSDWANEAEQLLVQNIQTYFALPPPRSQADQAQALANFDQIWNQLQTNCGQPGTGTAGIKCISDREAGACTWKQTATSPLLSIPGEPQPGACWNWFNGYRFPIQNDPDVAVASTDASGDMGTLSSAGASITAAANSVASSIGLPSGAGTLLLLAAAALAVVLVVS